MALQRFFLPFGAYSDTSAAVVARSAPTPRPVRNRISPNVVVLCVCDASSMPIENQA